MNLFERNPCCMEWLRMPLTDLCLVDNGVISRAIKCTWGDTHMRWHAHEVCFMLIHSVIFAGVHLFFTSAHTYIYISTHAGLCPVQSKHVLMPAVKRCVDSQVFTQFPCGQYVWVFTSGSHFKMSGRITTRAFWRRIRLQRCQRKALQCFGIIKAQGIHYLC